LRAASALSPVGKQVIILNELRCAADACALTRLSDVLQFVVQLVGQQASHATKSSESISVL